MASISQRPVDDLIIGLGESKLEALAQRDAYRLIAIEAVAALQDALARIRRQQAAHEQTKNEFRVFREQTMRKSIEAAA